MAVVMIAGALPHLLRYWVPTIVVVASGGAVATTSWLMGDGSPPRGSGTAIRAMFWMASRGNLFCWIVFAMACVSFGRMGYLSGYVRAFLWLWCAAALLLTVGVGVLTFTAWPQWVYGLVPVLVESTFIVWCASIFHLAVMQDRRFATEGQAGVCYCGYPIQGLTSQRCPECGRSVAACGSPQLPSTAS
ncbi:MAG: hypothetical protein SF069_04755 [Phycisphaerae bacterium]|nr:hypothetical protein [Phycisphaerae bacterium]